MREVVSGGASPGKHGSGGETSGMGSPSCSRLLVVSREKLLMVDLGWVELKPRVGPARRVCSDLLGAGSCAGTQLLQDF